MDEWPMDEDISDLVLHTRVAMLRGSLETVCHAIADLEQARRMENLIPVAPSPVERLAGTIDRELDGLERLVRGAGPDFRSKMLPGINAIREAAVKASAAEQISGRQLIALEDKFLAKVLSDQASYLQSDLDDIDEKVALSIGCPPGQRHELKEEAWLQYREALSACHELFVEYTDLIRGVLMRDAGLDRDLCRIADTIIGTWQFNDHVWGSISIPAEVERRSMSTAQLIRLGFPEWSVWSLPLIAREFGHVFARKNERIISDIERAAQAKLADEAELRSWAADIFATAVMGSAYPWAAMLLRVDPRDIRDQTRIALMLHTMELLDPMPEYKQPLPEAWHGVSTERVALSAAQQDFVRKVKSRIRIEFKKWEEANELVDRLTGTEDPQGIADSLQVIDLRNVFVAAWQVRIRRAQRFIADGDSGEEPEGRAARRTRFAAELSEIAERVRAVCICVIGRSPTDTTIPDVSQLPPLSPSPGSTDFGPSSGQWVAKK